MIMIVFAKFVFSPTPNAKSNPRNRHLSSDVLYSILLENTESNYYAILYSILAYHSIIF